MGGHCDDDNNNAGCEFDGGDCCGASVKKTYCKACKCLDPNYKPGKGCGSPKYKGDGGDCCGASVATNFCQIYKCFDPNYKPGKGCGIAAFKGDGNCDDDNNNAGCEFDGGDCCGASV